MIQTIGDGEDSILAIAIVLPVMVLLSMMVIVSLVLWKGSMPLQF